MVTFVPTEKNEEGCVVRPFIYDAAALNCVESTIVFHYSWNYHVFLCSSVVLAVLSWCATRIYLYNVPPQFIFSRGCHGPLVRARPGRAVKHFKCDGLGQASGQPLKLKWVWPGRGSGSEHLTGLVRPGPPSLKILVLAVAHHDKK